MKTSKQFIIQQFAMLFSFPRNIIRQIGKNSSQNNLWMWDVNRYFVLEVVEHYRIMCEMWVLFQWYNVRRTIVLLPERMMLPKILSSSRGCTSKAKYPSTSSSSFEKNFATNVPRPAYGGMYLKVADAVPETGTSGIYDEYEQLIICFALFVKIRNRMKNKYLEE